MTIKAFQIIPWTSKMGVKHCSWNRRKNPSYQAKSTQSRKTKYFRTNIPFIRDIGNRILELNLEISIRTKQRLTKYTFHYDQAKIFRIETNLQSSTEAHPCSHKTIPGKSQRLQNA
ncbi:hypothetical protein TorRG33x02_265010 [Trema orientale]|uniref:Uncharacterized protein n=1 Tax=Trema orientale TaxID=63057 RepID=A0A2P5D219_TREOI|nr:hypothetical protein TorRG33x02_265010 [Trema orientale]